MVTGWLLSKFDVADLGGGNTASVPVVASLSLAWQAATGPLVDGEWALVHVLCQPEHVEFFKHDPDVIWIGSEWSKVPQEVLTTYAAQLGSDTYPFFGQVLDKLTDWEPRFHLRADGWAH